MGTFGYPGTQLYFHCEIFLMWLQGSSEWMSQDGFCTRPCLILDRVDIALKLLASKFCTNSPMASHSTLSSSLTGELFLQLKLVSMMEKVIIMERKLPELVNRQRMDAVDQNLTGIQQRITQLEQQREREHGQQSSAGSGSGVGRGGGGDGGGAQVRHYNTVANMAGELVQK
jgi:hypothetical protein